jgi:hypothetical protein
MKKLFARYYFIITSLLGLTLVPIPALAHCPLCTAGAGLVAIGAYWFGVKAIVIGVAIGAFAAAMGLWFARLIKKQFIPRQSQVIAIVSWLLTILPLRMTLGDYVSWYVNWSGDYGSIFNRTYVLNLFLVGSIVGTLIMLSAPYVSRFVTNLRGGKQAPFQGIGITFLLIIFTSIILQII